MDEPIGIGKPAAINPPLHADEPWRPVHWHLLAEVGRIGFVGVFLLYLSGYVIWHSYLAQYGVTPHEMLRMEFLSSALCYFVIVIAFSIPAALAYSCNFSSGKGGYELVSGIWGILILFLAGLFFPSGMDENRSYAGDVALRIGIIFWLIVTFLKKRVPEKVLSVMQHGAWFAVYYGFVTSLCVIFNKNVDFPFVLLTTLLLPIVQIMYSRRVSTLMGQTPSMRFAIFFTLFIVWISHLHMFATRQFGLIPKEMGGARPEVAFILTKNINTNFQTFLRVPLTNGILGPVAILLHSEKEILLLSSDEPQQAGKHNAKLIYTEAVVGVRYLSE